jgi:hypothetical protein
MPCKDGELILDESIGCRTDDLYLIFSAGKALIAVLWLACLDVVATCSAWPHGLSSSLRHLAFDR